MGNCESRNAGTRNGTRNGNKMQSAPLSQQIRSPRKTDQGRIRYASDFDLTLANLIRGINTACHRVLTVDFSELTMAYSCNRCSCDKQEPIVYSAANNMDPGSVPPALQGLTQVEEMLISPVMPIMSLYQLPLGQYGYVGMLLTYCKI